jgi:hypothetical protein
MIMVRQSALVGAVLALASTHALAGGMVRSPGVSPNSAALGIGNASFSLSSYGTPSRDALNPTSFTAPFNSASGGDAVFYTDVQSPYNVDANYQSTLAGGATAASQLSAYKWFINGNTSAGGTRNVIGDGSYGSITSQTYSGGTSTITYNNMGTGSWRVNIVITTALADGPSNGQANVLTTMRVTRIGGLFNDANAIDFQSGLLVDLDLGASNANDSVTNASGSGEVRLAYADAPNTGQTLGISPNSWAVNSRSTLTTALDSSGALSNSITSVTDPASAYLWSGNLPTVGSTLTFTGAFSIGAPAAIPEPTALAGLGAIALLALRRKKA